MQLHAETPVGLAEGHGVPLVALLSSVTRLLALEQLVVQSETWKATDEKKKVGGGGFFPPHSGRVCVHRQKMLRSDLREAHIKSVH